VAFEHCGGVTFFQAFIRNLGNCRFAVKGAAQAVTLQEPEYHAKHRGGVMYSSDEAAVMVVERRHGLIRFKEADNYVSG